MISIVVITRNEQDHIGKCLSSIATAKARLDCEVILVDGRSTDRTVDIARDSGVVDSIAHIRTSTFFSAALGRHIGGKLAQGETVLFLDGDMEVFATTLEECLKILDESDGSVAGITGERTDLLYAGGEVAATRPGCLGISSVGSIREFGGAVILKRDALLRAGGYNPAVTAGEEEDLYIRLLEDGGSVLGVPVPLVLHHTELRSQRGKIRGLWGRRIRVGFGQAFRSSIENSALSAFLAKHKPFVLGLILDLCTIGLAVIGRLDIGLVLQLLSLVFQYFYYERRPWFYVINKVRIISLFIGWISYKKPEYTVDVELTGTPD